MWSVLINKKQVFVYLSLLVFGLILFLSWLYMYTDQSDQNLAINFQENSTEKSVEKIVGRFGRHDEKQVTSEEVELDSSTRLPLQDIKIGIDPGHGGFDPGYFTEDLRECDIVLEIALKLRRLLEQGGGLVVMTRDKDEDRLESGKSGSPRDELTKRVEYLSKQEIDLLVSIHANSISSPVWHGAQTFYSPGDEYSKFLSESIQSQLRTVLANTDRVALPANYFILNEIPRASALIEAGFLTNPREKELLQTDEYQELVAWSIYLGILDYYHSKAPQ